MEELPRKSFYSKTLAWIGLF